MTQLDYFHLAHVYRMILLYSVCKDLLLDVFNVVMVTLFFTVWCILLNNNDDDDDVMNVLRGHIIIYIARDYIMK